MAVPDKGSPERAGVDRELGVGGAAREQQEAPPPRGQDVPPQFRELRDGGAGREQQETLGGQEVPPQFRELLDEGAGREQQEMLGGQDVPPQFGELRDGARCEQQVTPGSQDMPLRLQMQEHVYDSLAEKLPKYEAQDAKVNTGYRLQNCREQPQMVNLSGSAVPSPGSKRLQQHQEQSADASPAFPNSLLEDQMAKTLVSKSSLVGLLREVRSSSPAAPRDSLLSMWRTFRSESVPLGKLYPDWSFLKLHGGSSSPNKLKPVVEYTISPPESSQFENIERKKIRTEIEAINSRLIDTEISITDDSGTYGIPTPCYAGTTIKISHTAVAFSPDLKSALTEFGKSIVMPVQLFVPPDYPRSSPMPILDKGDDQLRKKISAISDLVDVTFQLTLRTLPEPWSIEEIATAWDTCVREAVIEFAHRHGGGTFSSRFGGWKRCDGS